jgi:hypothetical protein
MFKKSTGQYAFHINPPDDIVVPFLFFSVRFWCGNSVVKYKQNREIHKLFAFYIKIIQPTVTKRRSYVYFIIFNIANTILARYSTEIPIKSNTAPNGRFTDKIAEPNNHTNWPNRQWTAASVSRFWITDRMK